MEYLKDKNIWVACGAGYLGLAVVKQLHEKGARIACIDLGNKAADFIKETGLQGKVEAVGFDLNDTGALPDFVAKMSASYGAPDGLVNLSFGSTAEKLETIDAAAFDQVNHAGITAPFILAREAAGYMVKNGKGSIVLFSSMYGMVAPEGSVYEAPMNKNPVEYGVGKAAIIQMTRYMAVHWAGSNVRCNCISPGPFPNPLVQKDHPAFVERLAGKSPMRRIGLAAEIAGPVAFLLSDNSSYITGHNLVVDGGWACW